MSPPLMEIMLRDGLYTNGATMSITYMSTWVSSCFFLQNVWIQVSFKKLVCHFNWNSKARWQYYVKWHVREAESKCPSYAITARTCYQKLDQSRDEYKNYNIMSLVNLTMTCNMIVSRELPTIYAMEIFSSLQKHLISSFVLPFW